MSAQTSILITAPSNIALIKYMGKSQTKSNLPGNASLSYTLEHLRTAVRLTPLKGSGPDEWQPLNEEGYLPLELSEKGRTKFLKHFQFLKEQLGIAESFLVESANNFPSDCGIASSASSFAALTLAAASWGKKSSKIDLVEVSKWSRKGSGSSCRSFFSPFALWNNEGAEPIDLGISNFLHQVLIISEEKKLVSSSEAHLRVESSAKFQGRYERAQNRLENLIGSLRHDHWARAQQIVYDEFVDMHELFETAAEPFHYRTTESMRVCDEAFQLSSIAKCQGPLVTMDAGANVHLLWKTSEKEIAEQFQNRFPFQVIRSW